MRRSGRGSSPPGAGRAGPGVPGRELADDRAAVPAPVDQDAHLFVLAAPRRAAPRRAGQDVGGAGAVSTRRSAPSPSVAARTGATQSSRSASTITSAPSLTAASSRAWSPARPTATSVPDPHRRAAATQARPCCPTPMTAADSPGLSRPADRTQDKPLETGMNSVARSASSEEGTACADVPGARYVYWENPPHSAGAVARGVPRRPRAQPVPPAAAHRAGPARQRFLDGDPAPDLERGVAVVTPRVRDPAHYLVARYERRRDRPFGIPAPVAAADAAGLHLKPGPGRGPRADRDRYHLDRPRRGQHGGQALLHDPAGSRETPDRRRPACSSSLARQKVRRSSGSSETLAPLSRSSTTSLIPWSPRPRRTTWTRTEANSFAITADSSSGLVSVSTADSAQAAAADQLACDDVALDLVRPLAHDHQRRVPEVALDLELGGVAVAAVDAHGVHRDVHRGLRGEQLGHAGLHVAALAGVVTCRGVQRQEFGRGQLGGHVGQVVADALVLPDRLAERLAFLRVPERVVEGGPAHAEGTGGDLDTAELQALHHLGEPLPLGQAEQAGDRGAVAVEGKLAALHPLVTELGQVTGDGEARPRLGQQDADAGMPWLGGRVGLAEQRGHLRVPGVGDPHLAAVDHVVVTVATGRRAHRLEVGAAAGLGERHRAPDLPGRHLREQPLTLLLGAELSDELGDDAVPAHRSGQAHPAARELGGDVDVAPGGDRSPAVFLRDGRPEDAELLHLVNELLRVLVGVLQLADDRAHLIVDKLADSRDD